jgi:FAD/FMN-containing dehydrogenase/Fe-S oxidoreductase
MVNPMAAPAIDPPARDAAADAVAMLRTRLAGRVEDGSRRRAEYSSDASNYRVLPAAVVFPRIVDDVAIVIDVARQTGVSVTARGGGTSIAGNAVGAGLVVDFGRHLHRILDIDPNARTANVQPGVVLADLQARAADHGLRFGPDPSSQARCTLGGMIGNNACGPRAVAWGRTAENVRSLEMIDGTGRHLLLGSGLHAVPELASFTDRHLSTMRTEFGRFGRQVSGYSLEHLLPEKGRQVAKALVGTEGGCGLLLSATVDLVPVPTATALAVLGYPDMPSAADDLLPILALAPLAVESMDSQLVDVVRSHRGASAVPELPAGGGWLFVETAGDTNADAISAAELICATANALASKVFPAGPEASALWRIREDGVGLAGRTAAGEPAWPGWEDAAVPPAQLGAYLRDFEALKADHGVAGLSYGHFGDGCVHTRLDLPLAYAPSRFRAFLRDAATLVVRYGGSLSGEHGDGKARSEFLPLMYSPAAMAAFGEFKAIFDPANLLNPGIIVAPDPVDADLRLAGANTLLSRGFALLGDGGDLSRAVHRCTGIGKCRADNSAAGGFMCPSYLATRDEKDSTRGRARVLQEMLNGTLLTDGWKSAEIADSLDLCLSCKACGSDCPAGVDMASYKSEWLYEKYRHRPRPITHYALGALPRWLRLGSGVPRMINAAGRLGPARRLLMRAVGIDPRRAVPVLAPQTFRRWWQRRPATPPDSAQDRPPAREIVLWMDSFTNAFDPQIGQAAVTVLEHFGYRVLLTDRQVCCGITWISTGRLDVARRQLRRTLDQLEPHLRAGRQIVGLEPSCTAVLRSDLVELLPDDPRSRRVAAATVTLAELLGNQQPTTERATVDLHGVSVLAQPHCHQHAVMGFDADRGLLQAAGATVKTIAGCCGLAGNFGMENGHYDVSVAVAENGLLPALRAAESTIEGSVFLADGFSCRTQADQLAGRTGRHLAELLAERLSPPPPPHADPLPPRSRRP